MPTAPSAQHRQIAALYTDHHGWLQGWLRRRLGDMHQAADLAHDTFMRLLARDEPVAMREPRAFLTTVAQRVLSNHYRRQQLERAYLDALAQPRRRPRPGARHLGEAGRARQGRAGRCGRW